METQSFHPISRRTGVWCVQGCKTCRKRWNGDCDAVLGSLCLLLSACLHEACLRLCDLAANSQDRQSLSCVSWFNIYFIHKSSPPTRRFDNMLLIPNPVCCLHVSACAHTVLWAMGRFWPTNCCGPAGTFCHSASGLFSYSLQKQQKEINLFGLE